MIIIIYIIMSYIIICLILCKIEKKKEIKQQEDKFTSFIQLQEIIDHMTDTRKQLQIVERLLLDVQIADDEQMIKFTWSDSTSDNSYNFQLAGENKYFILAMQEERDKLRSSMLEDVEKINRLRSVKNSVKNDKNYSRGVVEHE